MKVKNLKDPLIVVILGGFFKILKIHILAISFPKKSLQVTNFYFYFFKIFFAKWQKFNT